MGKKPNKIVKLRDYSVIYVQSEIYGEIKIKIDNEDVPKLKNKRIFISNEGHKTPLFYAELYLKDKSNKKVRLHRYLMNCPKGKVVDHINFDTLDNRKQNLQIVSKEFNSEKKNLENTFSNTGIRNITRLNTGYYEVNFYNKGKRVYRKHCANLEKAIKVKNNYIKKGNKDETSINISF